ncbi:PAAR domain-containing protein [sulfur-oxidizing endosymbiont of Gigantopelta aegis]|uniref:PAAR domain-containing protein n=1 Tax=sulfur-oxidizing endosymbiont of Gigantopelta aegis TaxID=2794934 RepID=UPI001FE9BAEE|nr:PAAR domain-containing protein [sulfur-oxidizing endosymbiont of Gigantopelta aegis]
MPKAARVGDPLAPHGCGNCSPHGRTIASGSSTVFINGVPATRLGDAISCGGVIIAGSGDVIIGDGGGSGSSGGASFFDTAVTMMSAMTFSLS